MPTLRTLATALLPVGHGLRLSDVTISPEEIVASLHSTAPRARCPVCGTLSGAIHSRYRRTVADLPWGGCVVRLHLHVRKLFCRDRTCKRRIFTERLPGISQESGFARAGGLMEYGPNITENYRRAAAYVDKILKGTSPADLPVERPTTYDFLINLQAARAIGLTIPQSVLQQATEIIQ